jgi:predicted HD phosphohydrolase
MAIPTAKETSMSETHAPARATFSHMEHGTREDWAAISAEFMPFAKALPDRVLAHRDGQDEEYVVCALLHDIGDTLGSYNHPDIAAAILKPFVSAENLWMVEKHGVFQGYYFFHHLGLDRNLREQYRNQPELFERTAEFCRKYDGAAFMTDYDTLPMSFFEPMVRRVLSHPRDSMYVKPGEKALAQP